MQIAVRVEPSMNHRFSARSPFAPEVSVEAATAEMAVAELREQMAGLIARGELRTVELPETAAPHPWEIAFGAFRDHPDSQEVAENMRAYREQRDQEAELP